MYAQWVHRHRLRYEALVQIRLYHCTGTSLMIRAQSVKRFAPSPRFRNPNRRPHLPTVSRHAILVSMQNHHINPNTPSASEASRWLSATQLTHAALFATCMAVAARLSFPLPFYPAPFSMQLSVVFLAGLLLPPRTAFAAMTAYLLAGLCGLPVFTSGGGPAYVLQPSFGYLVGFVVAAPSIAWLTRNPRCSAHHLFAACAFGWLAMALCGVTHIAILSAMLFDTPLTLTELAAMLISTLPLDTVKLVLAVAAAVPIRRRLTNIAK